MSPLKTILLVLAVALVAVGARFWLLPGQGTPAATTTSAPTVIGGPFTLQDSSGKTVTQADFAGKYMLVYFGYTYCPDVCPTSLQTMTAALQQLPAEKTAKLTPIFISVDPERDSLALIGQYVQHFYPGMVGLTGTPEQVAAAAKAYRVYFAKVADKTGDPTAYLMDHSAITYLMGPDGAFITHFPHDTTPAQMAAKLAGIL